MKTKQMDPVREALLKAKQIKGAAQENAFALLEEKVLRNSVNKRLTEAILREEDDEEVVVAPEETEDEITEEEVDDFLLSEEDDEEMEDTPSEESETEDSEDSEESDEEDLDEEFSEFDDEELLLDDEPMVDDFADDEFMAGEEDMLVDDFESDSLFDENPSEPFADDILDTPLDDEYDIFEEEEEEMMLDEEEEVEDTPEPEEKKEEEPEKMSERRLRREYVKLRKENRQLKRKVNSLKRASSILNKSINEVTLYNTKLAYTAKLIGKYPKLTLSEKKAIAKRFESVKDTNSVKKLYSALNEKLSSRAKKTAIKESRDRTKATSPFKANPILKKEGAKQNTIMEKFGNRYARLAGIKIND